MTIAIKVSESERKALRDNLEALRNDLDRLSENVPLSRRVTFRVTLDKLIGDLTCRSERAHPPVDISEAVCEELEAVVQEYDALRTPDTVRVELSALRRFVAARSTIQASAPPDISKPEPNGTPATPPETPEAATSSN